jgi:hypothetical protein
MKSNTPTIFQNSATDVGKSKAQINIESNKLNVGSVQEPTADFTASDMTKVTVREFPSGTTIVIDDTDGKLKIYEIHASGSYDAKLQGGDVVQKSVGNHIVIVKKDFQLGVKGNSVEVVNGNKKIEVTSDFTVNVTGKCSIKASEVKFITPDGSLVKPNCFDSCMYSGIPHSLSQTVKFTSG